jgi:hypothetical protein
MDRAASAHWYVLKKETGFSAALVPIYDTAQRHITDILSTLRKGDADLRF